MRQLIPRARFDATGNGSWRPTMTIAPDTLTFGRPFEARILPAPKRARAVVVRLRWAVMLMVLLNAVVWGGMIATARGMIDVHQLVDQAWAMGAAWLASLPTLSVTITR
jgi:hypothetical protein